MSEGIHWFSGQRVLEDHMVFETDSRIDSENNRITDLWTDGIIKGKLDTFTVSVDGLTPTLINVGRGIGYAGGERVAIETNSTYNGSNPSKTVGGISTPQSTGNRGVGLQNYSAGVFNYVWVEYLEQLDPTVLTINPATGEKHYIQASDGYQVVVSTSNPPGNPDGITNGLFLGRVTAHGVGIAVDGVTDLSSRTYMQLSAQDGVTALALKGPITDTQHGSRGNGSLHTAATPLLAGFMGATDKFKLDTIAMSATRNRFHIIRAEASGISGGTTQTATFNPATGVLSAWSGTFTTQSNIGSSGWTASTQVLAFASLYLLGFATAGNASAFLNAYTGVGTDTYTLSISFTAGSGTEDLGAVFIFIGTDTA